LSKTSSYAFVAVYMEKVSKSFIQLQQYGKHVNHL